MDDFRVVSVPSSDPFGQRPPSGSIARKREKQYNDGRPQDDAADIFDAAPDGAGESDGAGELMEDYYMPSDPSGDME